MVWLTVLISRINFEKKCKINLKSIDFQNTKHYKILSSEPITSLKKKKKKKENDKKASCQGRPSRSQALQLQDT
jgi:hypothetical protein